MNRLVSNLVILVIVGGTLTALVLNKEFWPFSHYPMYSVTVDYRKPCHWYGVYGLVEDDGKLTEVYLNKSKKFFPLNEGKMAQSLGYSKVAYNGRMWASYMEISDEFYHRKLLGLLKLYNRNLKKLSNPANEAPLVGIRLYWLEYPDKLPRPVPVEPTRVRLIAELRNDG